MKLTPMKCLKSLLLTGAVLSGMIAFGQETITISEPIRQVEINDFKPTKDMVSMDGLRGDVTISCLLYTSDAADD